MSRLSVFTVTRNRSRRQQTDRVLRDGRRRAGVHVRRRAHLERHPAVAHVFGQTSEHRLAVGTDCDVVDDADAMP